MEDVQNPTVRPLFDTTTDQPFNSDNGDNQENPSDRFRSILNNSNNTRTRRSLGEDILYTKKIEITVETAISLGLVQLPGICLGLLGIFKSFQTHGLSWSGVWDSAKSLRLFFVPFFLVELLGVFSSEYIKECCGLLGPEGKLVTRFDLLFFLGKEYKPVEKMLALEAAKMFFGSVLQLCLQLYFMEISTEPLKVSQYLLVT